MTGKNILPVIGGIEEGISHAQVGSKLPIQQ